MLLIFSKMNLKAEVLPLCKSTLLCLLPVSVQTELTWSVLELNSYFLAEDFSRDNYKCRPVINEENYFPEHVSDTNQIGYKLLNEILFI